MKTIKTVRPHEVKTTLSDKELQALQNLSKAKGLTEEQTLRLALIFFQSVEHQRQQGATVIDLNPVGPGLDVLD